jgi:hypothetical protein
MRNGSAILCVGLLLTGCDLLPETGERRDGGGGGGGTDGGGAGGSLDPLTSVENDLLGLFNAERTGAGLPALVRDPGLDAIELDYGREMASEHHLGHIDAAGRESEARARYFGGDSAVRCSEIVQWWGGTPSGRVHYDGYYASPPHHMAYMEQGAFDLGPTMHVGIVVLAATGPIGSPYEGRSGSYSAATLCDRALTLAIDPASE